MKERGVSAEVDQFQEYLQNQLNTKSMLIAELIQNSVKFACFSEAIDSAAMWGYYGDSGKGFAWNVRERKGDRVFQVDEY